jgi:hypothetical protein
MTIFVEVAALGDTIFAVRKETCTLYHSQGMAGQAELNDLS